MTSSIRAKALLAGVAAIVMMSIPAIAAPLAPTQMAGISTPGQTASFVMKVRDRRWRRGRHGNRFRGRRRGFTHFYDGYYYAVPWWEEDYYDDDDDYDRDRSRGGGDHEDWCFSKYKSYKPRSNTWTDYDGNTRECISPYGG
jgi:hypothetical protein